MADESRPRVAAIGGFYDLDKNVQLGQEARKDAEEIGRALAEAGFGLVVYFSDDKSLEPHVVRGFVAALPPGEPESCIDVRYSEAQRGKVRFQEQDTRPELFHEDLFPGQNWEAPFYRSLAARDSVHAVVLMAGGQSTLNAGQVAVGRGLPTLAIDKYPGSAQILRTELATRIDRYPSLQALGPAETVAWLRDQQMKEAERLRQERDRERDYARITSKKRGIVWFAVALVVLLTMLGLGLTAVDDNPSLFVLVLGGVLVSAGATGTLVRGLTTTTLRLEPLLASLLGVAAGVFVGLAYLIPQLIGAPQLLEPDVEVVRATDKIQFLSAATVALTAGIGFDVIFRRMLQEAKEVPVSVTR